MNIKNMHGYIYHGQKYKYYFKIDYHLCEFVIYKYSESEEPYFKTFQDMKEYFNRFGWQDTKFFKIEDMILLKLILDEI